MKPMMWMGRVSAWGAVLMGLAFAVLTAMSFGWGPPIVAALNAICAALLLVAAFRTLRRMSGGLRLLCGAWGLVAGLAIERVSSTGVEHVWGQLVAGIAAISVIGLALTVLHREK